MQPQYNMVIYEMTKAETMKMIGCRSQGGMACFAWQLTAENWDLSQHNHLV